MKYGLVLPNGTARDAADLAREAEQAGWDGFFVWEPLWGTAAWVSLTAAAMVTERIRLGTMLTPLPWIHPWKLASETATLDELSNGRVTVAIGLGANDAGAADLGVELERKKKASLMDEALDVMQGLWGGQPYSFDGQHYKIKPASFMFQGRPPVQERIPVWCVGVWPRMKSMRRILRCDGILPACFDENHQHRAPTLQELGDIRDWLRQNGDASRDYDIVMDGETPPGDPSAAAEQLGPLAEAGVTWWIETRWQMGEESRNQEFRERILAGPPRI